MASSFARPAPPVFPNRVGMVYGAIALWGVIAAGIALWFLGAYGFEGRDTKFYLLPWCVGAGLVIAAPSLVLLYRGEFNPFHPLVFMAWSYFFPGYFIGGLLLACGYSQPYFLSFIQDESYNLPLTLVYAAVGYACLVLGFTLSPGRRVGRWFSNRLPGWDFKPGRIPLSGLVLASIGLWVTVISFVQGFFGYQHTADIPVYSGLLFLVTMWWGMGSFLLWLYIFRSEGIFLKLVLFSLITLTMLARASFEGSRAGLVSFVFLVGFAYALSGRKITGLQYAFGSVLVFVALFAGMIYGTTFRQTKGTQQQISVDQYASAVSGTFESISTEDPYSVITDSLETLAGRMDAASSLAVVVSNYEALGPGEASWGLSNNIYLDSVVFLVPRVIWPDKPIAFTPEKYGDLYFSFGDNSFAMTPMGDLLRNFGPIGVPLGMMLLGMIVRVIYSALAEAPKPQFWRAALYFMLLTSISLEGTFSAIVPMLLKVGITAVAGLALVAFVTTIPVFRRR